MRHRPAIVAMCGVFWLNKGGQFGVWLWAACCKLWTFVASHCFRLSSFAFHSLLTALSTGFRFKPESLVCKLPSRRVVLQIVADRGSQSTTLLETQPASLLIRLKWPRDLVLVTCPSWVNSILARPLVNSGPLFRPSRLEARPYSVCFRWIRGSFRRWQPRWNQCFPGCCNL